jgi:vacuolar-type H+-ATPase subunit I/STV1
MNPKTLKTIFSKIAKDKTNLKNHKVDLSLLDQLNDIRFIDEQYSLLSYLAYEWHNEKFEEYRQAWMTMNDEYTHNGSAVYIYEDFENDIQILQQIKDSADELGIDVNEIYDEYDDHIKLLEDYKVAQDQYNRNEQEFRDWD